MICHLLLKCYNKLLFLKCATILTQKNYIIIAGHFLKDKIANTTMYASSHREDSLPLQCWTERQEMDLSKEVLGLQLKIHQHTCRQSE